MRVITVRTTCALPSGATTVVVVDAALAIILNGATAIVVLKGPANPSPKEFAVTPVPGAPNNNSGTGGIQRLLIIESEPSGCSRINSSTNLRHWTPDVVGAGKLLVTDNAQCSNSKLCVPPQRLKPVVRGKCPHSLHMSPRESGFGKSRSR